MSEQRSSSEQSEKGLGHMVEHRDELAADPIGFFLEQRHIVPGKESAATPADFLSPAHRAEMLWSMFQEVKSDVAHAGSKENLAENEEKDNQKLGFFLSLYNDPETKATYLAEIDRHAEEKKLMNGSYEKFRALREHVRGLEEDFDAASRRLFEQRGGRVSEMDKFAYQKITRELPKARRDMTEMLAEFPLLAAQASYERVSGYSAEFESQGFMWLPSRRDILEQIETVALTGRPVLLLGESGTGKSTLVRATAKSLTGMEPFRAQGGPSTRLQDSLVKQGVGEGMVTQLDFKALAQALTGKETSADVKPRHQGGLYFDDEFNERERAVQMEIIKTVSGVRPGHKVSLPLIGEQYVQPNYLFVAAGNPSSDRYDREPIDVAVRREFGAAVTVPYPEQSENNPELYEAMLAALMDKNRRLRFATDELSPAWKYRVEGKKKIRELDEDPKKGGAVWRFASGLSELYKSLSRQETVLKDRGEAQFLAKFVLDPGVVLGWLHRAAEEGYTGSLEELLVEKIEAKLAEADITQADAELVRDFFGHFNLLGKKVDAREKKPEAEFHVLTPREIGLFSPRVRYEELITPKITDGNAVIKGKSVKYTIEGTAEAPVDASRIEGSGAQAKRWRVLGRTDAGEFVVHSEDARKEKTRLVSVEQFLAWEAVDPQAILDGLDMGKLPPEARRRIEGHESRGEFRELINRERETIKKFFGAEIEVPPLPPEATPEKYKEWKEKGFELHFVPAVEMKEDSNFPGWKNKPGKKFTPGEQYGIEFFDAIKTGKLPPDAAKLSGAWLLVDTRRKPQYQNGDQRYTDDIFEPVLADFRNRQFVQNYKIPGSRFNLSPQDLEQPALRSALAHAIGIPVEAFHLPRAIDNNYLGNALYPEWGNTDTYEWFEDVYDSRSRLCGGYSVFGGLSGVDWRDAGDRYERIGFRPLGRFSSKK